MRRVLALDLQKSYGDFHSFSTYFPSISGDFHGIFMGVWWEIRAASEKKMRIVAPLFERRIILQGSPSYHPAMVPCFKRCL